MKIFQNVWAAPVLLMVFILTLSVAGFPQDTGSSVQGQFQGEMLTVPAGQKMNIDGVILVRQDDNLTIRSLGGGIYNVIVTDITEVKEKKSNPFRGAKKYAKSNLIPGLQVEVKGTGNSSGSIDAREVKFRNDDLIVAKAMDTRVVPVENELKDTQMRLSETEQNARTLSGQVQELAVVSAEARGNAKAAQESADNAMAAASNARSIADSAQVRVQQTNERITSLDDYAVKSVATVYFQGGSAVLSDEGKDELDFFAQQAEVEKGFLVEVAGFASSDGNEDYNRRLSKRRADAVIQYLAENYSIPLRRFLTPMGYGESQPVADNATRSGRQENRRVEVRLLVNQGLTQSEESGESGSIN
jgi:outer membrane protein OmpA-like peptidoglycan-associated protein